jgi:hypothetical protein
MKRLTKGDIFLILESLGYSKMHIREGCAPYEQKRESLRGIENVEEKLRHKRDKKL